MKKLFVFTAILSMTVGFLTGCGDTNAGSERGTTLALNIPATAVKVGSETAFTVMASAPVEEDLTVNLTSSNTAVATVPASVVIVAGTDRIDGKIKGVAEGNSTIKIAAAKAQYVVESVLVTVTK